MGECKGADDNAPLGLKDLTSIVLRPKMAFERAKVGAGPMEWPTLAQKLNEPKISAVRLSNFERVMLAFWDWWGALRLILTHCRPTCI